MPNTPTRAPAARRESDADLANAIRALAMGAVESAKSGHPGMPMGMAEIAVAPWKGRPSHNPAHPRWLLAANYNRPGHTIVDHRTWAFVGDGCLMEGLSHEACSLAGTLVCCRTVIGRGAHPELAARCFGESAPSGLLFRHFGFTAENIADVVRRVSRA